MGISTIVKAGKAAMDGKAALDNLDGKTAYGAGKSAATAPLKAWENVPRWVVRGLQFLFGLIVAGFYGHRIDVDRRAGAPQSGEWVFGVTIAGLSCITALIFALAGPLNMISSRFRTYRLFPMDFGLFLFWIIVFGIFGGIFLKRADDDSYKGTSTTTQRAVVWLDLLNALLWLLSGTYGGIKTLLGNKVDGVGGRVGGRLFGRKKPAETHEQWYGAPPV